MASRFWVGGTGTWDASDTTHWSATSGGAGGASVPGSSDTVTFNGSSGGGTVTVNTDVTVQSITCGAFTGTLDFSANNNNVTLSSANAFSGSGTGTRTINLGNGTWTFTTAGGTPWNMATTTNLTFNANSSILAFTGVGSGPSAVTSFVGGGLTYNAVQVAAQANGSQFRHVTSVSTFASFTMAGPNVLDISVSPLTAANLALNGTASGLILVRGNPEGTSKTLSVASNAPTMNWCAFRDITCSGGASFVANNSFDLGHNSGVTINGPSGGGGHIATRQQLGM